MQRTNVVYILSSGDIEGGRARAAFADPTVARVVLRALYRRERLPRQWRDPDDRPTLVDDGELVVWSCGHRWWEVRAMRVQ